MTRMVDLDVLGEIETVFNQAENIATRGLEEGGVETEPTLTDRLIGGIEMGVEDIRDRNEGYRLRIRTLRDRGRNAPEKEFGADAVFVLDIDVPEITLKKGFLAQAKLSGSEGIKAVVNRHLYNDEISVIVSEASCYPSASSKHLRSQCDDMLAISPASFIFVYDQTGISVVPAITISRLCKMKEWQGVHAKPLQFFMRDYLHCFVGDPSISAYDDDTLRRRMMQSYSQAAVLVQVRPE